MVADFTNVLHLGYADGNGDYFYQKCSRLQTGFTSAVEVGSGARGYGGPALSVDQAGNINYFFTGTPSGGNVPLKIAQSTDGGNSFNTPLTLVADGKCPSAGNANTGATVVAFEGKNVPLSDNSDIFVSYQRSGTIYYPPVRVVDSAANDGLSTNPSLAVTFSGNVDVIWQDSRNGDTDSDYDIFFAYTMTGLGFSQNVRVNNNIENPGSQTVQDYPSIGTDMMGRVFASWRDFRDGPGGNVYFTVFMPGLPAPSNTKLNDDTSSPTNISHGPPNMVVSSNAGILVMWGDERNATSDLGTPLSGPADIFYCFGKLF